MTDTDHADLTPYQRRLEVLLGDRDPLDVLADTPERLEQIVVAHPAARLRQRPGAGKWTPNEILGHLADAEWAWGWRLRHGLGDDDAEIRGFDQEQWVVRQRHDETDPAAHVATFAALRGFNLPLWRRLGPADLARTVRHAARGPETLGRLLRVHAGHDLAHLDQLERYLGRP